MKKNCPIIALLIIIPLLLCACSKEISVSVNDAGETQTIRAMTGTTVEQTLEEADISVATNDEVSPVLDSEITENTTEITIKRYAKVTVTKGKDKKEIELVGGTVQDAIDKSGFTLKDGDKPDHDADEYLTDGMIIKIRREKNVTLKYDNKKSETRTKADTVQELLDEQAVTLGDDDEISEDVDSLLEDKMTITIKRVKYKEETRTESIDYDTVEKTDDSMYKGESKVTQEGAKGEKEVTYMVKYVDGEEDSEEKISETVTKKPTDKIVVNGTKSKKLSQGEAESIIRAYWNYPDGTTNIINSLGTKTSGGSEYYVFTLRQLVNNHYSTIDQKYVNAYTGSVVSTV